MNKRKLPTFRKKLEKIRADLIGDAEQTLKLSKESESQPAPDISDEATRIYHSQLMQNLGDQEWETFKLVDEALEKIENGGYGICRKCDQAIPEARLNIVPFAQYCVECQNVIEKERAAEKNPSGL
ncbi:MAG: TraR/DksA family transcriptional regulator [Nitrospinales bacterium]